MNTQSAECRHGNRQDCYECLGAKLKHLETLLGDEGCIRQLVPSKDLNGAKRWVSSALSMIGQLEMSAEVSPDTPDDIPANSSSTEPPTDQEQYHSAQSGEPLLKRPKTNVIVRGSAFGASAPAERPIVVETVRPVESPKKTEPVKPVGEGSVIKGLNWKRWNPQQVEDLRVAVEENRLSWIDIPKKFDSLKMFSNVQLKDKYRAAFGTRASANPRS